MVMHYSGGQQFQLGIGQQTSVDHSTAVAHHLRKSYMILEIVDGVTLLVVSIFSLVAVREQEYGLARITSQPPVYEISLELEEVMVARSLVGGRRRPFGRIVHDAQLKGRSAKFAQLPLQRPGQLEPPGAARADGPEPHQLGLRNAQPLTDVLEAFLGEAVGGESALDYEPVQQLHGHDEQTLGDDAVLPTLLQLQPERHLRLQPRCAVIYLLIWAGRLPSPASTNLVARATIQRAAAGRRFAGMVSFFIYRIVCCFRERFATAKPPATKHANDCGNSHSARAKQVHGETFENYLWAENCVRMPATGGKIGSNFFRYGLGMV